MAEIVAPVSREYAAGDDWQLQFTVVDVDGVAVDITSFTVKFAMARRVGGAAIVSTEASPASATATLTTPASGIFTIDIDALITAALEGDYYFEAEVTDTSSDTSTVSRGIITVQPTQL